MFPDDLVIGIDRSLSRLNRNAVYRKGSTACSDGINSDADIEVEDTALTRVHPNHRNVLLVRAELSSFWRLCIVEGWEAKRHYLLYPNPYPKRSRLKSRFYAHPSFPLILKLGGDIVLRSNWEGYLREFGKSVMYAGEYLGEEEGSKVSEKNYARIYTKAATIGPVLLSVHTPLTNFEEKYASCGERLYELCLNRSGTHT